MGYKDRDLLVQTSLYDRVSKLLESFECSDCSFSVSGQKFQAHRLILSISSPVFKAMFYGPLSSNNEIIISDIEPDIFQLLINFIYTDKVHMSCIEQAFELLYASKKYLLECLTEKCIDFIEENLSVDNVIPILNFSEYVQEKRLIALSLQLLSEHAQYILSESVQKLSIASLKLLLECDLMNISEKDLINLVFKWSINYCKLHDIPVTVENRRNALLDNDLFDKLRFLSLTKNDFKDVIERDNLLLSKEAKFISECLNLQNNVECVKSNDVVDSDSTLCKKNNCRDSLKVRWFLCHRSSFRSAAPLVVDSLNNQINVRLRSDKTVFINGLRIPTRMSPLVNFHSEGVLMYSEQLTVTVIHEPENCIVKSINFMNTVEYDSHVFIEFSEPFVMKMDEWYKINFKWPLNRSYSYKYLVGHRSSVARNKASFEFDDVMINNNTDGSFLESIKYS